MWYCFYFNKLGCINILSFLKNKNFISSAWKFKECFGLKQAFDCYELQTSDDIQKRMNKVEVYIKSC